MKSHIGIISQVKTMADHGLRVQTDLNEMPSEEMAALFAMKGKEGFYFFSPAPIRDEDIKDLPEIKTEKWQKTPGQRLRGVLFLVWQKEQTSQDFESWYIQTMERLIDHYKTKLD